MSDHEIESLRNALRRVEPSTFSKRALAMLADGETPDAETLKRAGIRHNGEAIV